LVYERVDQRLDGAGIAQLPKRRGGGVAHEAEFVSQRVD
jgi:hypothetical protein